MFLNNHEEARGQIKKGLWHDEEYHNGVGTGNRHPDVFSSWIDYWQVLSDEPEDGLCCSNVKCGCNIVAGLSDELISEYNRQHPLNLIRQACGAHVEKERGSGDYYIVPLCDKCNAEGSAVTLRAGTILVKEVAPNICDDE